MFKVNNKDTRMTPMAFFGKRDKFLEAELGHLQNLIWNFL